jgi:ParB family chromosome partitioning protein
MDKIEYNHFRRYRKHMGDIKALADSIRAIGLLQPIVVRKTSHGYRLIAGERRLRAVVSLDWQTVPAYVVDGLDDAMARLRAERDENTCRKDFAPSEAVAIGRALEDLEAKQAKERQSQAGPAEGKGKKASGSGKLPEAVGGRTRDKVGEAVGMSGKTYEKAKQVVEAAEAQPQTYGDLAEQMDATGKVDPAFKEMKDRRGASPKRRMTPTRKAAQEARAALEANKTAEPSRVRTETFLDLGDVAAPKGSPPWCVFGRNQARMALASEKPTRQQVQDWVNALREEDRFRNLADSRGNRFLTWEAFCQEPPPYGFGMSADDVQRTTGAAPEGIATLLDELDEIGRMHECHMSPVMVRMIATKLRRALCIPATKGGGNE